METYLFKAKAINDNSDKTTFSKLLQQENRNQCITQLDGD